ncbi:MAG: DUF3078 domain-containing protein [Bacteroidales bacterium]|nr:DUF3078 domain-containing protein [Bacteroidales bacterium]
MKYLVSVFAALALTLSAFAQDAQSAAAEAAAALSQAEEVPAVETPKPKYWTNTVQTNINFGQTYLSQWAAGGYNTVTLAGNIDASANYAKDKMIWNNRLQLDYGTLYSADKPIYQKNKDRIYFESKWGYETPIQHLSYSANFDFKTQFGDNFKYGTPVSDGTTEPTKQDWLDARTIQSGLFSPAYINLGLGLLWTPKPWFSLNVAPLTGGVVIVSDEALRDKYGMEATAWSDEAKTTATAWKSSRFEFGAQLKADASWVINDNFTYTTQLALFYNYLTPKVEPRITWDNKVFWKLAKYFALTVSTNLIYDPLVKVKDTDNDEVADAKGVQFKEYLEFGFTYTLTHKR